MHLSPNSVSCLSFSAVFVLPGESIIHGGAFGAEAVDL